jgi:hypothetical protein
MAITCSTRFDPAVARPGEPVPSLITGRRIQRCDTVPGRKPLLVDEPVDIADVAEQTGRAAEDSRVVRARSG